MFPEELAETRWAVLIFLCPLWYNCGLAVLSLMHFRTK